MKYKFFILFILTINILLSTSSNIHAQDNAPTYQSLMALGDKEFQNEQYIKAKTYYQEALRLKKEDPTANSKLNKTLQKIREQSEKEEQFYEIIDIADNHYDKNEYEKALAEYNKAIKIFPKDSYALERIKHINEFIKSEKDKLNNFNVLTTTADNLRNLKKYSEALSKYEEALKLYPTHAITNEKYHDTKKQKAEYDRLISDFESLKKEGYELALRKRYSEALDKYNAALSILQDNSELQETIKSLEIKKEASDRYNSSIGIADALYLEQSYENAKDAYKQALAIIPDDAYASGMIAKIEEMKNSIKSETQIKDNISNINEPYQNKTNNSIIAQEPKEKPNNTTTITESAEYKQLISTGDTHFNTNNFDKAIEAYTKALALNTGNTYPSEMINHINEILQNNKLEELVNSNTIIASNSSKRFNFNPIDVTIRKSNYIFIKAKNTTDTAFTLYVTYGSKNGRSGSFILRIPDNQNTNDYIIRIGSQYKWFSEDNSWIELRPENGNVEIELMEITKGN